jgi:hypothetical protein
MKAIDLSSAAPTLTEVLELAENENVIVRTPEGREFVVAESTISIRRLRRRHEASS